MIFLYSGSGTMMNSILSNIFVFLAKIFLNISVGIKEEIASSCILFNKGRIRNDVIVY